MDRIDFLKNMLNSRLFKGLSLEHMDELISLAESQYFTTGITVIKESDNADSFFWVESGRLEVQLAHTQVKNKIPISYITAGDLFGEMVLLGFEKRSASVVAKEKSNLFMWKAHDCLKLFQQNKDIGYQVAMNLASILGSRIRDMNLMLRNYADILGPDAVRFL